MLHKLFWLNKGFNKINDFFLPFVWCIAGINCTNLKTVLKAFVDFINSQRVQVWRQTWWFYLENNTFVICKTQITTFFSCHFKNYFLFMLDLNERLYISFYSTPIPCWCVLFNLFRVWYTCMFCMQICKYINQFVFNGDWMQ